MIYPKTAQTSLNKHSTASFLGKSRQPFAQPTSAPEPSSPLPFQAQFTAEVGWMDLLWQWANDHDIPELEWIEHSSYQEGGYLRGLPRQPKPLLEMNVLKLSSLKLSHIHPEIARLKQLEELILWGNRLTVLPETIGHLQQLRILSLEENQLTTLTERLGDLKQLQKLNLSWNQLAALPTSIGQLQQLQELTLWGNRLMNLPDTMGQLQQLRKLTLWGNRLLTLPASLGQLQQLRELTLGCNPFTTLPEELGELQQLQTLWIDRNKLHLLPKRLLLQESLTIKDSNWDDLSLTMRQAAAEGYHLKRDEDDPLPTPMNNFSDYQTTPATVLLDKS